MRKMANQLDAATPLQLNSLGDRLFEATSREAGSQIRRHLATQWDQLLQQVRGLEGFQDFLKPAQITDLSKATHSSTLVIINMYGDLCDALAFSKGSTTPLYIRLAGFSETEVTKIRSHMSDALSGARILSRHARQPVYHPIENAQDQIRNALATLWAAVVKPVLDKLGYWVFALTGAGKVDKIITENVTPGPAAKRPGIKGGAAI
ncbi:hypothetical protein FRC12_012379 [Ceratobasidium sp. 428]|nr:hypothetical protein FRC12_012379 [Ceratobasidium sp. 428]